ncbi:MAG: P-loop NTPase fold protein [Melioribacteraceae bacterium]|nr:P-loop NTPase fold protein [Melioribacteraceae bacterium]
MSEKELENSEPETNKNNKSNWLKENAKLIASIFILILFASLFTWFYNFYLFKELFTYDIKLEKWWVNVFYTPLFTFTKEFHYWFNGLYFFGILILAFFFRCSIWSYFEKFFKSFKIFGALIQHYSVLFLFIIIVTPVIFNYSNYQQAILFNGDFIIIPLFFPILLLLAYKKNNCKEQIENKLFSNDGDPITSFEEDLLEFDSIVSSISADIISVENKSSAHIIGLSGDWGSGKTSLFNLLVSHFDNEKEKENALSGYKRIRVIKLNVHKYEKPSKLYLYLFDELLTKLQDEILIPRLDSFFITKTVLLPLIKEINLDSLLNKVMPLSRVDKYLETYSSWLQKMDLKIVCLIDDVDRLHKQEDVDSVLKLLNLVKHNMSNIILFVNFDPDVLSKLYKFPEAKNGV